MSDSETLIKTRRTVRNRLTIAFSLLCAVLGMLIFPFPMYGRIWSEIFNLAHAPTFFGIVVLVTGLVHPTAVGLPTRFPPIIQMTPIRIGLIAVIALATGLAGEFLQAFVGRTPTLQDAAANASGVLAAILWITGCIRGGRGKVVCGLLALSIMIFSAANPLLEIREGMIQNREFPLIASFERTREANAWQPNNATIKFTSDWSTDGDQSMLVTLKPAEFSGVLLHWPPEGWNKYRTLHLDLLNREAADLPLAIKVADRTSELTGYPAGDRYESQIILPPNETTSISIDLSAIEAGPSSRMMKMDKIAMFEIFSVAPSASKQFSIDNIRLK